MPRSTSVGRLAAGLLLASSVLQTSAQTSATGPFTTAPPSSDATSPTGTITSANSAVSATAASVSASDAPESLWGIANSLLSSYYPSTTITQVYSLSWPTAVVIESSTYSVHPASVTDPTTSVLAEASGSPTNPPSHGLSSDKKLGIGIGVAVGAVALIVLGVILCCLHRRRKATGVFFKRRPTPSVSDSDIEGWRSPTQPEMATMGPAPSREWTEKYSRMSGGAGASVQPPPMALHPAFARQYTHWSNGSSSEENPFFTPNETPDHYEMSGANTSAAALAHHNKEVDGFEPVGRASLDSAPRGSRPPTPFSPMLMMGGAAAGASHQQQQRDPFADPYREHPPHDPFSSPEDDEADDIVSPIIPTRSPERRHSPMVHYPSWSEVSEFDFTGSGRGRASRQSLRGQSSSEEGGDGWRPMRDSVVGRHELA